MQNVQPDTSATPDESGHSLLAESRIEAIYQKIHDRLGLIQPLHSINTFNSQAGRSQLTMLGQ